MDRNQHDRYSDLTDAILNEMRDANPDEWQPGWVTRTKGGRPINATTSKRYRGGNVLQLWLAAAANGYPTNEWAGYGQWKNIDAQVRKGEKSTLVRYVGKKDVEDDTAQDGKRTRITVGWQRVFNASQVDGYEPDKIEFPDVAEIEKTAEDFLETTGADIRHGGDRALWNRVEDYIAIPDREQFISTDCYYATTFHELTHWTGAAHRLDRDMEGRFGGRRYAAEELVAELGAHFLAAEFDIEATTTKDTARYLSHWIELLENDNKAIFTAASLAADAVDYTMNLALAY